MDLSHAIFLGTVQGLTEFFPISSSGHLVFFQSVLGWKEPRVFFDVLLHLGTLLAVIFYFRHDVWLLLSELKAIVFRQNGNKRARRLIKWIVAGTIPTGLMGIFLRDWFESIFANPLITGVMMIVTGVLLWLTRRIKPGGKDPESLGLSRPLAVGIAQGIAIIPGISRSGATISTALFLGLERELSGRFSFLLSIPAILGAMALEFGATAESAEIANGMAGFFTAFVTGLFSLKVLMKFVREGKLYHFSYYCWGAGISIIVLTDGLQLHRFLS